MLSVPGLAECRHRLAVRPIRRHHITPLSLSPPAEHMEVVTEPREQDPETVSWKGACLMACMESAGELWIRPSEWRTHGVRTLREKVAFYW